MFYLFILSLSFFQCVAHWYHSYKHETPKTLDTSAKPEDDILS